MTVISVISAGKSALLAMSLEAITPMIAVKVITVPMALAGVALTSDAVHGANSKDFRKTFGFGAWFTPLVGIYEGTVAALLWYQGGAHRELALRMLAVVLGGVEYAHVFCEGNPGGVVLPLALNALAVVALQDVTGAGAWVDIATTQAALNVAGMVVGLAVSALSPGKPKEKDSE